MKILGVYFADENGGVACHEGEVREDRVTLRVLDDEDDLKDFDDLTLADVEGFAIGDEVRLASPRFEKVSKKGRR